MMPSIRGRKSPLDSQIAPTRILVVDDEPLIRWSLCSALAAEGFDAVSAADAAEARRLTAEWPPPRVVLFDLRVPDADGLAVISDVRKVYPDCRFVMMTTATHLSRLFAFNDGVELIQKPFDLAQVIRLVTELAGRRTELDASGQPGPPER